MRSAYGATVTAPSTALLQFLRSQAQDICFFSSSPGWNLYKHLSKNTQTMPHRHDVYDNLSFSKDNEHRRRHDATNEASLFNFNLLCHTSNRNVQNSSTRCAENQWSFLRRRVQYDNAKESRQASTLFRPLLQRLSRSRPQRKKAALKPDDLPERPSFLDDVSSSVLGRSKVGKASNEMKLRCTELNENGTVTLVNGEFKKSELIAKASIRAVPSYMNIRS